jgi:hypothetical protein
MNTKSPFDTFMSSIRKSLSEDMAEVIAYVLAYDELYTTSQQLDEEGRLTKEAHRAKARLRNPFRLEESPTKTRDKISEQERKRRRKLTELLSQAGLEFAKWYEKHQELEELNSYRETGSPIDKSREDHGPESMFALGYPFIEMLARLGVSPSSMGRLPQEMMVCIADLIKAHARDPHLKDPNNPWKLLFDAGVLEAPIRHPTHDQQQVIMLAHSLRSQHQNEFAEMARQRLNLPAGFSEEFLVGAARIADLSRELTQGEAAAFYHCAGLQYEQNIALAAKILGLDSEQDRVTVAAIVELFTGAARWTLEDTSWWLAVHSVKEFVDKIDPAAKYRKDWVAELIEGLPDLARSLSERVDSIEVFNHLLVQGLALTDAKKAFDDRKATRDREEDEAWFQDNLLLALQNGAPFKLDYPSVWSEGSEYFDAVAGEVWTCAHWIEVHGRPAGLDDNYHSPAPCEDEDSPGAPVDIEIAGEVPCDNEVAATFSNDGLEAYQEAEFETCDDEPWIERGADDPENQEIDLHFEVFGYHENEAVDREPEGNDLHLPVIQIEADQDTGADRFLKVRDNNDGSLANGSGAPDQGALGRETIAEPDSRSPLPAGELPSPEAAKRDLFNFDDKDMR